jgi:hypothetical protein
MNRSIAITVAAVALSAAALPAAAGERPYRAKFFAAVSYVSPLSESEQDFAGVVDSLEATEELGWEFGLGGRFSERWGFELSYVNATQEVDFGGDRVGEIDFEPISATLEFHLVPGRAFDLWIGPTVSWVRWGDLELENGTEIETDAESAFGATLGFDIGLGDRLALTAALRYLDADADLRGFEALAVDPLFARVGLAVRF